MRASETKTFLDFLEENEIRKMAEIGVLGGNLAKRVIAKTKPGQIQEYHMVDPWTSYNDGSSTACKATKEYMDAVYEAIVGWAKDFPVVHVLRMRSVEAARLFEDGHFDLVYIDAAHDTPSVLADIRAWAPKIKDGGIISGHDYGRGWRSVVKGVDLAFPDFDSKTLFARCVWHVRLTLRIKESVRLNTEKGISTLSAGKK